MADHPLAPLPSLKETLWYRSGFVRRVSRVGGADGLTGPHFVGFFFPECQLHPPLQYPNTASVNGLSACLVTQPFSVSTQAFWVLVASEPHLVCRQFYSWRKGELLCLEYGFPKDLFLPLFFSSWHWKQAHYPIKTQPMKAAVFQGVREQAREQMKRSSDKMPIHRVHSANIYWSHLCSRPCTECCRDTKMPLKTVSTASPTPTSPPPTPYTGRTQACL